MALEDEMKLLREAVTELTSVSKLLLELRANAIEMTQKAAAPAAKAEKKTTTAAADTSTGDASADTTVTTSAATDAGADPYAEAKDLVGKFTSGSTRPEEVQARKDKVKFLLRHKDLVRPDLADPNSFSVSDVKVDAVPILIKNVKALIERGDITTPPAAAGDIIL